MYKRQVSLRDDRAPLDDIVEACSLILSRMKGVKLPDFISDRTLQDSVVLRLIVIGEAAKHLSPETRKRHRTINWKDIARLRDLIVHPYWDLDVPKIWEIVRKDVPQLLETLT